LQNTSHILLKPESLKAISDAINFVMELCNKASPKYKIYNYIIFTYI
jgi:hypothetical protein